MAEVYYFGVYQYDPECDTSDGNPLLERLINLCALRDELWNWLADNIPGYYPGAVQMQKFCRHLSDSKTAVGNLLQV